MVLFDIMASHWAMMTWHDARLAESTAALAQLQQVSVLRCCYAADITLSVLLQRHSTARCLFVASLLRCGGWRDGKPIAGCASGTPGLSTAGSAGIALQPRQNDCR